MTIHNLGSKTDLLELHNNAVVASTGAVSVVALGSKKYG